MNDGQPSGSVYYRFTDASGRVHIVDSLDRVPSSERAHAEKVELGAQAEPSALPFAARPTDFRSFALGAAAALLLVLVFRYLPRTMRFVLRFGIVAGLAALLMGGYFSWIRRAAGHTDGALATPQALMDDAKGAVDKLNERMRAQDRELEDIERASGARPNTAQSSQPK